MNQTVDTWILGVVLVLIQTALTSILGLIIKKHWDKKNTEREELEKLREEKRNEEQTKTCNSMKEAVHTEIVELEERLNKESDEHFAEVKEDIVLLKDGLQKDLYIDLCHIYDQYKARLRAGGFISREEKTEYDKIYWSYHKLGKNGIADGMHKAVMEMPEGPKGE